MPKRILVYAQHLSGVGHYVRTYEIARALSAENEVYWIEGGRPVPHRPAQGLRVIELPRIQRGRDGSLQGLDPTSPIETLMHERVARLLDVTRRIRPEVFLVEYFPFSKWELEDELLSAIGEVRAVGGRVFCSLRDVVRRTRFETAPEVTYSTRVTELLNRHFDALLVHADPAITRLEEHFPAVADIQVPIHYTGLVSEKLAPAPDTDAEIAQVTGGRPYVLASAGGGAGGRQLIDVVLRTWREPGFAAERMLMICAGLGWTPSVLEAQAGSGAEDRVRMLPFRADFLNWLAGAEVSISQCGYNTAANLLETRTPAIVSPNPEMSDQIFRAQRLADCGLLVLLSPYDLSPAALIEAMRRCQSCSSSPHRLRLDGAEATRARIEAQL